MAHLGDKLAEYFYEELSSADGHVARCPIPVSKFPSPRWTRGIRVRLK